MTQIGSANKPIVIVGAGISGLTLSILLKAAKKEVIILEKRSPYRSDDKEDPRSFNLTITERGMKSFREIGLEAKVLEKVVPLESRVVHDPSSCICSQKKIVQRYGSNKIDKIFSIKRSDLINIIFEEAKKNENAKILFDSDVTEIDKVNSTVTYRSKIDGKETVISYDFLIGADGAYSKVRNFLLTGEIVDLHINYFSWVYKKFTISSSEGKVLGMDPASLHVFPQKGALAVAIPNQDGSFSSIYCTDIKDLPDIKSEEAHKKMESKFMKDFPHLFHLSEKLRDTLKLSKISGLVDVNLSKWRYEDKIVLVGDAAHAVFPFYGQGMNSALQDCRLLVSLLSSKKSMGDAFAEYESIQKESTNALSTLCKAHFHYLQEKSFSPLCQARRQIDSALGKFPFISWSSEYSLVAQTELPYNKVKAILRKQSWIRTLFGITFIDYVLAFFILTTRKIKFLFTQLKRC
jgi:kynurenine 3-monooxygenase